MQIPDSHIDKRFFDNPLVTDAPHVRFYAGAPLETPDGHILGTLCVIDDEAMTLSDDQLQMLRALARQVVSQLELRRSVRITQDAALQIEAARLAAEEANRSKTAFLANMSHELRTPLNSVIGFTNILLRNKRDNLNAKELDFLSRIGTNGRHLLDPINDVLDISKIEAGAVEMELEPVSLAGLLSDVITNVGGLQTGAGVTMSCDDSQPIVADRRRLTQVLINLVGNGIKFSDGSGVHLSVIGNGGRPLRIDVTDAGIGISPDKLTKVFAPFEQADVSTAREYGGTGLGLAISRALCRSMGFDLEVASEEGIGSTFSIRLADDAPPVSLQRLPASQQVVTALGFKEPPSLQPADRAHRTLLVIDDDSEARLLMQQQVEDLGFRVIAVGNGADGIEVARAIKPDAITVDLMMAEVDGFEVIRQIRADSELRDIPLIVCSTVGGEYRAQLTSDIEVINKPVSRDSLERVLERMLTDQSKLVLIVDDDPDARRLVQEVVEEQGCRVRMAANGAEGLSLVISEKPDLIVLDLMMPIVDGFTFLEQLRQLPGYADLPVILCTAKDLTRADLRTLNGDADNLVRKNADTASSVRSQMTKLLPEYP
jgi:signal transduction histidine kinase/DNA-binding response OmpR family regulator